MRSIPPSNSRWAGSPASNSANLMLDEPPLIVRMRGLVGFMDKLVDHSANRSNAPPLDAGENRSAPYPKRSRRIAPIGQRGTDMPPRSVRVHAAVRKDIDHAPTRIRDVIVNRVETSRPRPT